MSIALPISSRNINLDATHFYNHTLSILDLKTLMIGPRPRSYAPNQICVEVDAYILCVWDWG